MTTGAKFCYTTEMYALPVEMRQMKKDSNKIIRFHVPAEAQMPSPTGNHFVILAIISKALPVVVAKRIAANVVGHILNITVQ